MLNIVVPMAGRGSRFESAGYRDPKPLIPVNGMPMIQLVIGNLRPARDHRFIFVCQRDHVRDYGLAEHLPKWTQGRCEIVEIDGVTDGAARTVLKAREAIDSVAPLMIANSDQYIDIAIDDYLAALDDRALDGLIMTMVADDPKWSFAATDGEGIVTHIAEKKVISRDATVGIYNFAYGRDFVAAADAMIAAHQKVNGEFYVAPVYNGLIASGKRFGIHHIGGEGSGMYGLGTPVDLEAFLALPLSHSAVDRV